MTQTIFTNRGLDAHGPFDDARLVPLTKGPTRADAVNSADVATVTIPGQTSDGDIAYNACGGGSWGNAVVVEHMVGDTGVGHESRDLEIVVADKEVCVVFGTDVGGASDPPTANALVAALGVDEDARRLLAPVAQGDGSGLTQVTAKTPLSGGDDNGDYFCIQGRYAQQVARREAT